MVDGNYLGKAEPQYAKEMLSKLELMGLNYKEFPNVIKQYPGHQTIIDVDGHKVGGNTFTLFAGPCRAESLEQTLESAKGVKEAGAHIFRAGAYKPCTSPHSDWGRGREAIEDMVEAKNQTGLKLITEAMDEEQLELVEKYSDIIQLGTRAGQNYPLIKAAGNYNKPIFLKRGTWMDLRESLCAAEWVTFEDKQREKIGNPNVMICERGLVGLNRHMRWTLDYTFVPSFKDISHLPVIVDISHGTGGKGNTNYYGDLARAAVAVGADGLMVEVHPNPEKSMSDSAQTLSIKQFKELVDYIKPVVEAIGKKL
jgi:3-deoxy-7-phosphoheptulonate synthase